MRSLRVVGAVPPAEIDRVAGCARLATLEEVLAWCHARGADVVDVIVQDEFTHDVLVRVEARGGVHLCYDTT